MATFDPRGAIHALRSALETLLTTDPQTDWESFKLAVRSAWMAAADGSIERSVHWLMLNVGSDYAICFESRVGNIADGLQHWCARAMAVEQRDGAWHIATFNPLTKNRDADMEAAELLMEFRPIATEAGELYHWIGDGLRVLQRDLFQPSECQREILSALDGQAMTADDLQHALNVSRHTLFGGKNRRGGLNELTAMKLVENSRKVGGYFRPDRPPAKKAH